MDGLEPAQKHPAARCLGAISRATNPLKQHPNSAARRFVGLIMTLVEFSSGDPAVHLACDEVLLGQAEAGERDETLRFSEIGGPVVVMGIGSRWRDEVSLARCREDAVPVLRRSSGGASVVLAHGCLNYAAVLDTERDAALTGIRESYGWILSRVTAALDAIGIAVEHAGLSDLALKNRKIGGSAQRRKRRFILHHGTLLYDFDLSLMSTYLEEPPATPEYRAGRIHSEFVANVSASVDHLRGALMKAFDGTGGAVDITSETEEEAAALADSKYGSDEWTFSTSPRSRG